MSKAEQIRTHDDAALFRDAVRFTADVSDGRLAALRKQIEPQLRPVLRERDFGEFDLERAFKIVVDMAKAAG